MEDKPAYSDDRQAPGVLPVPDASATEQPELSIPVNRLFDAFCEVEMSGRIVRWNEAFLHLTGYSAEEVGKLTYIDLTPEKWHAFEEDIIRQQVIPRGHSDIYEKEYRRKDGSIVPIQLRACLTIHPDGSPKSMWAIIRDISERKRAEKLLLDAARRWQATFDALSIPVAVLDLQQRIVLCNAATMRLLNLPMEQILDRHCFEVFHARSSAIPGCPYCTMRETGRCAESEVQVGEGWYEIFVDPLIDPSGKLAGGIHIMYDITERKRALDQLRKSETLLAESERAFRELFESSLDGVFRIGADTRIQRVNKAYVRMFGYESPEEMVGKSIVDYWENPAERSLYLAELRKNGHVVHYPFSVRTAQGKIRRVEVTANLIRNERGEYSATEGIIRDVTDQHHLQEQLHHAQKMESVGRLAGSIAHDFNNILSAMLGYASLPLMTGKAGDEERNTLQRIIALTERAVVLTKGLLAFSRGQMMAMKPADLNHIVGTAAKLLHRLIREDITLVVKESAVALPVRADAGQIEQVLMNLAINAQDAMPGGGTLTIETHMAGPVGDVQGLAPGDYAMIRVSDTGTGIAPEHMDKIFEPFFTTKELGKGTGLGLPSVYGIVHQHGGAVRAESVPGAGTTFLLYLPISVAAGELLEESPAEPGAGGSETILVAEDDMTLRRIAKAMLEARGYAVLEAASGAEAVAVCDAEQGKIDLLLTDVVMPELGGIEAWDVIHAKHPAMRVVFMSGYISDEGRVSAIERLGLPCVPKPFDPRQLFTVIRKELDRA